MAKSHFYGFIQGSAENPASRIGRKDCPLSAELAGWNGRINVRVWHNATKGVDEFQVSLRPHWNEDVGGTESCKVIASGILDHRALKDPYIPALIA